MSHRAGRRCVSLFVLVPLAWGVQAQAQEWPARVVKLVVGFPAGGGVDVSARAVADGFSRSWKQQVIVDNRPGASGAIAATIVAKSDADGYTIFVGGASSVVGSHALKRNLPFNVFRDFQPIGIVRKAPFAFVVHPSVPAHNVKELIAIARAKPGTLTYASFGVGSSNHLVTEVFKSQAKVELLHVPYKGSTPARADLLSGQVDMLMDTLESVLPFVESKRMRAVGYAGAQRSPLLPDVPTVGEAGLKDFEGATWDGLFVPIKTPGKIVDKISQDLQSVVQEQTASLRSRGMEPAPMSPAEFKRYLEVEIAKWADAAMRAGIKPE